MLRQFMQWLDAEEKSAQELLEICLRRIAEIDPAVHAWVDVSPQPALGDGPLRGIPFGAADAFDARIGVEPSGGLGGSDATVVTELRRTGAVLLGRTQSAIFGCSEAPPTCNPRIDGHTSGGSSSGSAVAVAAGMVPFAVGTQTQGSVLRPASFCGVAGFKPSRGLVPAELATSFAPSFDTVGFFTETATDMAWLWSRGFGGRMGARLDLAGRFDLPVDPAMSAAFRQAMERLRAEGVRIVDLEPPREWPELRSASLTIADYEGARADQESRREAGHGLGPGLADLVRRGGAISDGEYQDALDLVKRMESEFSALFWEYPVLLTPAAAGPAPTGLEFTEPAMNAPWTALGVPAISVPLPVEGPPLGLQVTAAWGRDDALVSVAMQVEELLSPPRGLNS